jgi:enterochelin esterase-like enzyme
VRRRGRTVLAGAVLLGLSACMSQPGHPDTIALYCSLPGVLEREGAQRAAEVALRVDVDSLPTDAQSHAHEVEEAAAALDAVDSREQREDFVEAVAELADDCPPG